jgi:MFS family permease
LTFEKNALVKISLPILLISLPLTSMSVLLPVFTTRLGLTPIQVTGLFSVFSLGLLIFRLIVGYVSDKVGRKPIFILGILFYVVSYFVFYKATTLPLIYLARGLQSIAAVFISISTFSMISDLNGKNNAYNFGKLGSYSEKGGLFGIALCFAFLYNNKLVVGWANLFFTCSVAAVIALVYSLFNIMETKSINNNNKDNIVKFLLPSNKMKIALFNLVASIFTSVVSSIFVLYLQARFDSDLLEIALAFILPTMIIAFSSPRIGTISDNIGAKNATTISLLLLFITLLVIPYLENIYLYGVIWTIYCIALTMLNVTISSIFVEGIVEETKGSAIGQLSTATNIGNTIGPIVGGLAFQNIGLKAPYLISSLGFVILFSLSLKNLKHPTP